MCVQVYWLFLKNGTTLTTKLSACMALKWIKTVDLKLVLFIALSYLGGQILVQKVAKFNRVCTIICTR